MNGMNKRDTFIVSIQRMVFLSVTFPPFNQQTIGVVVRSEEERSLLRGEPSGTCITTETNYATDLEDIRHRPCTSTYELSHIETFAIKLPLPQCVSNVQGSRTFRILIFFTVQIITLKVVALATIVFTKTGNSTGQLRFRFVFY